MHRAQFLFSFHNVRYVTDGFDGEGRQGFQPVPEFLQPVQPAPAFVDLLPQDLLLLLQENGDHAAGILLSQQFPDGVQRKTRIPQEADNLHLLQVFLRIQPAPALGQGAGNQDPALVVKLYRPDGHAAGFGQFSGGVL